MLIEGIFLMTEAHTPTPPPDAGTGLLNQLNMNNKECGRACYQPWKDIIIPGHVDYDRGEQLLNENLPTAKRPL